MTKIIRLKAVTAFFVDKKKKKPEYCVRIYAVDINVSVAT